MKKLIKMLKELVKPVPTPKQRIIWVKDKETGEIKPVIIKKIF